MNRFLKQYIKDLDSLINDKKISQEERLIYLDIRSVVSVWLDRLSRAGLDAEAGLELVKRCAKDAVSKVKGE